MAFSLVRSSDSLDWFCYMADIVVDVITRNVSESLQKKKKKYWQANDLFRYTCFKLIINTDYINSNRWIDLDINERTKVENGVLPV